MRSLVVFIVLLNSFAYADCGNTIAYNAETKEEKLVLIKNAKDRLIETKTDILKGIPLEIKIKPISSKSPKDKPETYLLMEIKFQIAKTIKGNIKGVITLYSEHIPSDGCDGCQTGQIFMGSLENDNYIIVTPKFFKREKHLFTNLIMPSGFYDTDQSCFTLNLDDFGEKP